MTILYPNIIAWMCIITCTSQCKAFKILAVFPIPAGSHRILGQGVVNHLLKAGHEVTYITPYPKNHSDPNLREISVSGNISKFNFSLINIKNLMTRTVDLDQGNIFHMMINFTRSTLESESVLHLLNDQREHFDLVIAQWTFNEVYSGFAAAFDCPYIWFFPYEPNFVALSLIDEATNPAYTANIELNYVPPFTFWQRLKSLRFQIMSSFMNYLNYRAIERDLFERTFTPIVARKKKILPPYEDLRINASLIFGNYHFSLGQAMRLPQNYIPIAGQHIDAKVAPLPKDLKKIMDNASDGVIYFSMGSNMKSDDLPDSVKHSLFNMFSGLKQTVLWKFEGVIPNLPSNVHILKWAPQLSILSHRHCVMFISHGGLLSTNEAIHFGVPIISIPVYFDHLYNAVKSVDRGIGIKVDLTNNLAEDLRSAIQEMLNNSMYRERMKQVSFIYHHRLSSPGKELVHWAEHVILTGGAPHLRSPALLLPWYQKMYLDLVMVILLSLYIVAFIVRRLYAFAKQYRVKAKLL